MHAIHDHLKENVQKILRIYKMIHCRPLLPEEHLYESRSHQCKIDKTPFLRRILTKIYVAHATLELGTETRFATFQIFHRCLSHYIYHNMKSKKEHLPENGGNNELSTKQKQELSSLAVASIFLGCKLCNEHRRLRDVINIKHVLQMDDDLDVRVNEVNGINEHKPPPSLDEEYWKQKEEMVRIEQTLLRIIDFDVNVSFPHRIMILIWEKIIKKLEEKKTGDLDEKSLNYWRCILHNSWKRLNSILFNVDCMVCSSSSLACAALSLAIEDTKAQVPDSMSICDKIDVEWWVWLDVTYDELSKVKDKVSNAAM